MNRNNTVQTKILALLPIVLVMIIVFLLSMRMHWHGDAVTYSFFIPANDEYLFPIQFNSVWEIWTSQINHYYNSNGRFFCHCLVQFFCAFMGQTWFSVFNTLMWGIFMYLLFLLSRINKMTPLLAAVLSALTFLLFYSFGSEARFPFEPPHQINYVWMGCLNLYWIYLFFKYGGKLNFALCIGLTVLSFCSGQSNEGFSVPISGSLIVYACVCRFRLSPRQWLMSVVYGLGALTCVLSPGSIARANGLGAWSMMHTVEHMLPSLIIPLLYFVSLFAFKDTVTKIPSKFKIFVVSVVIINYLFGIYTGMGSGSRTVTCANSLILIFILARIGRRTSGILYTLSILAILVMTWLRYEEMTKINAKNLYIEDNYRHSEDGVVVMPDKMFLYNSPFFIINTYQYMLKERVANPDKRNIAIRPSSMGKINLEKDTNIAIKIAPQAWVLIRSKKKPVDFIVKKTILPGILNKSMSDRTIDWNSIGSYSVFDSTANWKAALYVNERPYIKSTVVIDE